MRQGLMPERIAEDLVEDITVIEAICHVAEKFGPECDPEAVIKELENKTMLA